MNFEKYTIRRAIFEIRFEPQYHYSEKRDKICSKFLQELPYWQKRVGHIILHSEREDIKSKKRFGFENKRVWVVYDEMETFQKFITFKKSLVDRVIDEMNIKKLIRIGMRLFATIEGNMNYDDLRKMLIDKKIYRKEFQDIFEEAKDLAFVYDSESEGYKFHSIGGAVNKKELIEKVGFLSPNLPETSFFIDIDYFKNNIESNDIDNFIRNSWEKIKKMLEKLKEYLNS